MYCQADDGGHDGHSGDDARCCFDVARAPTLGSIVASGVGCVATRVSGVGKKDDLGKVYGARLRFIFTRRPDIYISSPHIGKYVYVYNY